MFQYKLTKKSHFKCLIKNQLKTITIFLLIFTFFFYSINLEFFIYNFPYNTLPVLITYVIYLAIIFTIMILISLLFSFIMTKIFEKNKAYKIYKYKIDKNNLQETTSNYQLDLTKINKFKIKKNYIKIISLKLKQRIIFEKQNFINDEDFKNLKEFIKKEFV